MGGAARDESRLLDFNNRLFRLKALAVLAGRLAEVFGAVAAEVGEGGKIHLVGYLGERQALVTQIVF